uniref:Uncharacterized protein n=1 Tax=Anopheles atroparvus TaxID=41427 RepID=A0A182JIR4_ANOAO
MYVTAVENGPSSAEAFTIVHQKAGRRWRCQLHVPQGCVVKNIRIKQKLARLRQQQRMLAQHLQHLEESPDASPAQIQRQHQRYNNLLRYYSSWDKVSAASSTGPSRPLRPTFGDSLLLLLLLLRVHVDDDLEDALALPFRLVVCLVRDQMVAGTKLTLDFVIVTTPTLSEKTGSSQVAFTL